MVGMRFAIDVVFVDRGWRVVDVAVRLPPFALLRHGRGADAVLELPVGAVSASGTQVGDDLVAETAS